MTDSIVKCTVYKDEQGIILYYEITFSFDGVTVSPRNNPIYVVAEVLSNPTDLVEVKKAACQQASAIKTLYSNAVSISDLNGPVIL